MYTMMGTALHDSCANLTQYCAPEEYSSVYRFITGYCNHKEAHQGESFTAYVRLELGFFYRCYTILNS